MKDPDSAFFMAVSLIVAASMLATLISEHLSNQAVLDCYKYTDNSLETCRELLK